MTGINRIAAKLTGHRDKRRAKAYVSFLNGYVESKQLFGVTPVMSKMVKMVKAITTFSKVYRKKNNTVMLNAHAETTALKKALFQVNLLRKWHQMLVGFLIDS